MIPYRDNMDILPRPRPHTGGADQVAYAVTREPADQSDGVGCDPPEVEVGEQDAATGLDGEPEVGAVVSISTPGPAGSQADAEIPEDLAAMGVRELIGLLAHLEDASRGRQPAAWAARWTVDEVDADWVLSRQRQVIRELRGRRARAQRLLLSQV